MLPNFLVIGAQRCGTTWIHKCLLEHPEVFVPEQKELDFFTGHYHLGLSYYEKFFVAASGFHAVGEITPHYIIGQETPKRIADVLPDAHLIAIFRNPVDRAYSFFKIFGHVYDIEDFEQAVKKHPNLIEDGIYYRQVENYLRFFPKERFLFLLYDDLSKDNLQFVKNIFIFLKVSPDFVPSVCGRVINAPILSDAQELIYKLKLGWVIDLIKSTPLDPIIRTIYRKRRIRSSEGISSSLRTELAERYREPNRILGEIIGRDLTIWN